MTSTPDSASAFPDGSATPTAVTQPIVLVTALRAVFWLSPMVTGSLALSPIRFRDYLLGSFLGFVPSVVLVSAVIERVAALLV